MVEMKVRRAQIVAELAAIEVEKEKEAAFAEAAVLEEALEDNDDYLPRLSKSKGPPPQLEPEASQPQQKQSDKAIGHSERTTKVSLKERLVKDEEDISPEPADQATVIHHDLSFPSSSLRRTVGRSRHGHRHSPNVNA